MRSLKLHRSFRLLGLIGIAALAAACSSAGDSGSVGSGQSGDSADKERVAEEVQAALSALPDAKVVSKGASLVPDFISGNLGAAQASTKSEADVQSVLAAVAPVFRTTADKLLFRSALTDNIGDTHYRFAQLKNGREVIGGELIVHVRNGVVYAANGSVRDDQGAPVDAKITASQAVAQARGVSIAAVNDLGVSAAPELFYYRHEDDRLSLVYSTEVTGAKADGTPIRDTVLVNATDGTVAARIPHIHTARNREVHNLNHGTSLPGPVARTETGAASSDAIVNTNFGHLGTVYDVYKGDFGRDSFDGTGGKLISSVHYSTNYVNAFWNGTQMVYGDGDGVQASNLAASLDVTGHELTHAVTERTSNLTYSGQSGGLNEATSDIFGAYIEWVRDGRGTAKNETTWTVGDDCWTPGTPGDGLRYMYDPKKDGSSIDWGPDFANQDVHYTSGVPNLAFYLLSVGGTHPRGKSTVQVAGIGIAKAAQVFFRANTTIWTAGTTYAQAKTGTVQAATQLGYTQAEIDSVSKAWEAVGVGVTQPTNVLTNGVPVTGISGATGSQKFYSLAVPAGAKNLAFTTVAASSGDADIYVKFGSQPSTSSYDCRSIKDVGQNEACNITTAQAGTYYVLVYGYSTYTNTSLTGKYSQ